MQHGGDSRTGRRTLLVVLAVLALVVALSGCSDGPEVTGNGSTDAEGLSPTTPAPTTTTAPGPSAPSPSPAGSAPVRRPERALLSVPVIGLRDLPVLAYRGTTDDRPGTRIQDRDLAASPTGPRGGVGPGEVGNYLVTAHRTTGVAPFADLPDVRRGDRVLVEAAGRVYEYRVTTTRSTSFRSARSLARQRAAVPGRPGAEPTRAMITLSTCATPEDFGAGNTWTDALGNPEHRIDKVGVLVDVRPA